MNIAIGGNNETIDALTGSGSVNFGGNPDTLTIGSAGGSGTFSGVISGTGGITKTGAGTQTLTGTNTYIRATTISVGTLQIGGAGLLGSGAYAGNITNNAAFVYSSSANQTNSGVISGSGSLTKDTSASSTLTLSGTNTYGGGTTISNGVLRMGVAGAIPGSTALTVESGGIFDMNSQPLTVSALAGGGGSISNNAGLTVNSGAYGGVIAGTGGLTKTGAGTLILSGANSYNGGTTVSNGMLRMGAAGAIPGSTALTVESGGIFDMNSQPLTVSALAGGGGSISNNAGLTVNSGAYGGVIAGGGVLTKSGAGTLILSGANSYSGGTIVSNGTLTLSGGDNRLATNGTITAVGGVLDLGGYVQYTTNTIAFTGGTVQNGTLSNSVTAYNGQSGTVSAILAGSVGLTKTTGGTLTLTGANTYSGLTTISAGTLELGNGGSVLGSIVNNAGLTFNRSGSTTVGNDITGAVSALMTVKGGGTNNFTGSLAGYSGNTTVSNATAYFNHSGSYSGVITAENLGTVGGTGTVSSVNMKAGSLLSPGNSVGTLTLTSDLDLNGARLLMELAGTNTSDKIMVSGNLNMPGTNYLQLALTNMQPNRNSFYLLEGGPSTGGWVYGSGPGDAFTLRDLLPDGVTDSGLNGTSTLLLTEGVEFYALGGGTVTNQLRINYNLGGSDFNVVLTVIP
ncbi:MAG: autotransporter-associated beta strand repeat-containing protein, partial [Kiritimatiellaeota bacterium]|nr:autotransporter-associated beta strand repeat-containing protein [Kiritimatiellota bacterium]